MLILGDNNCSLMFICVFSTAKKFGVTEFVNPKDHDKPVQEVSDTVSRVLSDQHRRILYICPNFDLLCSGDSWNDQWRSWSKCRVYWKHQCHDFCIWMRPWWMGCCCTCWCAEQRWFFQNPSNECPEWEDSQGDLLRQLQTALRPSFCCREVHEQGKSEFPLILSSMQYEHTFPSLHM